MENVKNKALFEQMKVPKAVLTMAVPTVIGQLIVLIYNMADTYFIGKTNDPMMVAGASLILPLFNISLSVASLAGVGGGALISRLLGEHRLSEAKRVSGFSILFSAMLSLLFSIGVFVFMRPLLYAIGAKKETFAYARTYALCVVVLGGLPTIMTNVLSNLVRSVGESGRAGFGVTLGGLINIALDPLFMFVLLPDGKEILGAGLATCLSNVISCTYFIVQLAKLSKTAPLGLSRSLPEKAIYGKIFAIGIPAAVATLLFDVDYMVIDKLVTGHNNYAMAAMGIVLKVERLPLNVGVGICQGMVPIIAYNFAAKNFDRMRKVSRFSLLLGVSCALVSIALYEIFAPGIMRVFIKDSKTVAYGTNFLRIRCVATLFMFLSFYHVHLFNGYGRGREAITLALIRWLGLNIPMLFILNRLLGIYGIAWTQLIADALTVLISAVIHRRFLRRKLAVVSSEKML